MNIVAKTTYGKFVMVCHGKFRDLSGVAVIKCKKASKKISANFNLADQVKAYTRFVMLIVLKQSKEKFMHIFNTPLQRVLQR